MAELTLPPAYETGPERKVGLRGRVSELIGRAALGIAGVARGLGDTLRALGDANDKAMSALYERYERPPVSADTRQWRPEGLKVVDQKEHTVEVPWQPHPPEHVPNNRLNAAPQYPDPANVNRLHGVKIDSSRPANQLPTGGSIKDYYLDQVNQSNRQETAEDPAGEGENTLGIAPDEQIKRQTSFTGHDPIK